MTFYGTDFILTSLVWLTLVFLFIFMVRKKIFKRKFNDGELDKFIKSIQTYLKETYPNFEFNFKILSTLENIENPNEKKYLICDDIVTQYTNKLFTPKLQSQIAINEMWGTYVFDSKPNKDKIPKDWLKRKLAVMNRDKKICLRCSKKSSSKDSQIFLILPIKDGGQYFIENMVLLCEDCNKIENQKRDDKKINFLHLKDELYNFV
jgi:hypothetical protein